MSDLLTIQEAAKALRQPSARWLRDWLHENHPLAGERPYYILAGRNKLFRPTDLSRIEARIYANEIEKAIPKSLLLTRGCVYFVCVGEFVKIGWALEPRKRLRQLQIGSPHELEVLAVMFGTMKDEKEWHQRFAEYRHRGEWFRDSATLRRQIKALRNRVLTKRARSR